MFPSSSLTAYTKHASEIGIKTSNGQISWMGGSQNKIDITVNILSHYKIKWLENVVAVLVLWNMEEQWF